MFPGITKLIEPCNVEPTMYSFRDNLIEKYSELLPGFSVDFIQHPGKEVLIFRLEGNRICEIVWSNGDPVPEMRDVARIVAAGVRNQAAVISGISWKLLCDAENLERIASGVTRRIVEDAIFERLGITVAPDPDDFLDLDGWVSAGICTFGPFAAHRYRLSGGKRDIVALVSDDEVKWVVDLAGEFDMMQIIIDMAKQYLKTSYILPPIESATVDVSEDLIGTGNGEVRFADPQGKVDVIFVDFEPCEVHMTTSLNDNE